jgi:hypothetical protein
MTVVFPVMCSADEHSGVAIFPAGSTTIEALFDTAVKLLEGSGVPVTFSDRMNGEVEASVTLYHTTSVGCAGKLLEDIQFWRLSFRPGSRGTIELKIVRGSALELPISEIARFVGELAGAARLNPAMVSLSMDEEARPVAQPKIASQEVRPVPRATTSFGFDIDLCQFRVYEPIQAIQADFIAKFALDIGADGSVKDIVDITRLTRDDARRWGLPEKYILSGPKWLLWNNNEAYALSCLMRWKLAGVPPGKVVAEFQWDHRYGWVSLHISGEGIDYKVKSSGCGRGNP